MTTCISTLQFQSEFQYHGYVQQSQGQTGRADNTFGLCPRDGIVSSSAGYVDNCFSNSIKYICRLGVFMPLFVDHAGMNTLINDDIDTSNNIRTINDRLSPFQYSIKASDTSTENPFVSSTSDYNDWPDGAITYSFWVKLEGDSTSTRYVLHGINEYDSDRDSESIRFESNYLRIYIYDQDSSLSYKRYSYQYLTQTILVGHVSITWDGDFLNNNISFYIDGQLAAETPETSSVGSPSGDRGCVI